jgi:hypothetical protein
MQAAASKTPVHFQVGLPLSGMGLPARGIIVFKLMAVFLGVFKVMTAGHRDPMSVRPTNTPRPTFLP